MRYYVTELEGHLAPRVGFSKGATGLSTHVIDRAYNCRVVFTARTEDVTARGCPAVEARERIRQAAQTRCDHLNRLDGIARSVGT